MPCPRPCLPPWGQPTPKKVKVQRPNTPASIQDISEGLSEPQSSPKICWSFCYICLTVQLLLLLLLAFSTPLQMLYPGALTSRFPAWKSLFQNLFPGKLALCQLLTEVVLGSKIWNGILELDYKPANWRWKCHLVVSGVLKAPSML